MTCCHGSSGTDAALAAASSALPGSTAVRALVTARRSGATPPVTCSGEWAHCRWIPAASRAGVYGEGPPGSQPLTSAPRLCASNAAALAPAPAAPTTWIRSPSRIGRASLAGARPLPTEAAPRTAVKPSRFRRLRRARLSAQPWRSLTPRSRPRRRRPVPAEAPGPHEHWPLGWPLGRPPKRSAERRHLRNRPRRCMSGRSAWPGCRRLPLVQPLAGFVGFG